MDIRTETINRLAKVVCWRVERFKGLVLSFTFGIGAQEYAVPDDDALRKVLLMMFSQGIRGVKVFIKTPPKQFSEWKLGRCSIYTDLVKR